MTQEFKLEKVKNGSTFDCEDTYVVLQNQLTRTVVVCGVSLYPKDKANYCGKNDKVESLIKENKLKVVESRSAKSKTRKIKEEKSEESLATVADVNTEQSVQLTSSEEDVSPSIEQ